MSFEEDNQQFEDKVLICTDRQHPSGTSTEFVWTKGEQKFIHQLHAEGKLQGDITEPKRCKGCRLLKKARYERSQEQAQ